MSNEAAAEEENANMQFEITGYPQPNDDGETASIVFRSIALGAQPLVLIEPAEAEDGSGDMFFRVAFSELDLEQLEGILELTLDAVRQGRKQVENDSQ